jgi:hypothetical protein
MLRRISDCLRRFAGYLEDPARVADRNETDIRGEALPEETAAPAMAQDELEESKTQVGPGAPRKPGVSQEAPKPTAGPQQRTPRRQPAHSREWNPDTRRQKMREYMQEYRGTGKINQRSPQTRGA